MTDDMMNLRALLEKTPDADLLREMIGFAAQRLMELEVEGLTGATYGEKSQDRLVQRNGYRDRIAKGPRFSMRGVPAIAANPREGSRLLRFWVKVPNTSSEIGTTLSRARACGRMQTGPRVLSYPRHSHLPQIDSRPGLYRRVGDACRATSRVGDSHLDCRAALGSSKPMPNLRKPLARYGAIESALARGLLALCPQSQPTACRTRLQYNRAWSINPSIRANLKIAPALDRVSRSAKHRT
jgi:hypothetical protein